MPFPPPRQARPTPPMAQEQQGMAVGAPDDGGAMEPQGGDFLPLLAELETMGVQMSPGPNGTLLLAGIPAEVLAQMAGGGQPEPGPAPGGGGGPAAI
jgi:hypothetical protein